ncbi:MAG: VWA domain-containing protein [Candidatus Acidiferrales bacterium]|jgi:VWFA-related protein
MTRSILSVALLLLLGVPVGAQSQAQPPATPPQDLPQRSQNPPPIISRTETVVVPATIKDSKGQLVAGLEKGDFRIFSDGVEQIISRFSSDAVPLSAVVLIDDDLPERAVADVQKSLVTIAAGFGPRDEVAFVKFDQYPTTVFDFSFNNDQLFTQLKRFELNSHPTQIIADATTGPPTINGQPLPTATGIPLHGAKRPQSTNSLDDALYAAGDMLKTRGRDRRKIIFLVSDGSNSRNNHHTFEETLRSLLVADVSVYSISTTRSVPVARSLLQHGESELNKYAYGTGGDAFFASKAEDLERLYSDVTEQARNEYTLTFSPQEADRTKDFHSIEVRVERPGLSVIARDGYYQSAIAVGR